MRDPHLAAWIISQRGHIDRLVALRLGPAAPGADAAETEVLRRFRSFAASALQRGTAAKPALDGLRANERRVTALLHAWADAAVEVSGDRGALIRDALDPLLQQFQSALRTTGAGRRKRGSPRAQRRAVVAAIDRVADAFLAVDADTGRVVDANPAAGALLGVARDALLGVDALSFVPNEARGGWWTEFDAMTEGSEPRRFAGRFQDVQGKTVAVECTVTRFSTRDRTLALILARPAV
jgi:PAS domain S-box-containing protein